MQNNFWIFDIEQPIRCMVYYKKEFIILANETHLILFNISQGSKVVTAHIQKDIYPIKIILIDSSRIGLQGKTGTYLVWQVKQSEQQFEFQLLTQYQIKQHGFNGVAYCNLAYNLEGNLLKTNKILNFYSIDQEDKQIHFHQVLTGQLKQTYLLEEQTCLNLSIIKTVFFEYNNYLLICQQGGNIFHIEIKSNKQKKTQSLEYKRIKLDFKRQIKLITNMEFINRFRLLISLREDSLIMINWLQMNIIQTIQIDKHPPQLISLLYIPILNQQLIQNCSLLGTFKGSQQFNEKLQTVFLADKFKVSQLQLNQINFKEIKIIILNQQSKINNKRIISYVQFVYKLGIIGIIQPCEFFLLNF